MRQSVAIEAPLGAGFKCVARLAMEGVVRPKPLHRVDKASRDFGNLPSDFAHKTLESRVRLLRSRTQAWFDFRNERLQAGEHKLSSSRVFPCAAACCSCFLCYCPKM